MICKFKHDGDCCNCGSPQYMAKCKDTCGSAMLMTNADRIRAMSDEELAAERIDFEYNPNGPDVYIGDFGSVDVKYIKGVMQPEAYAEALRLELEWLKQPADK